MPQFSFADDYILEDEVVLLRPLRSDDFEHLLPFSIHEPDIWKYSLMQAGGQENLRTYLRLALEARDEQKEYPFIVFDKRASAYAGSTRFYDIQNSHFTLQLGYTWYGTHFQGTGLNKHCKYLLLEFVFEKLQFERVEFRADNDNKRSIQAMQSIGCTVEGVLRSSSLKPDGRRRDNIVLSILKDEWNERVKQLLKSKLIGFQPT